MTLATFYFDIVPVDFYKRPFPFFVSESGLTMEFNVGSWFEIRQVQADTRWHEHVLENYVIAVSFGVWKLLDVTDNDSLGLSKTHK